MELIVPGQKLSINIEKDDKLVEIIGTINKIYDDRIDIELPQYFMRYIECLDVGKKLTIKVFSKMGTVDFNTVVITSPLEENFCVELDYNALKLTPNEELPTIDAIENLNLKLGETVYPAQTIEISTEQMKISCDIELPMEGNYDCELLLPEDYDTIYFKANIIEHDVIYDNEYTLSYYAMNEQDRQTLLYFMYVYVNSYDKQEQ